MKTRLFQKFAAAFNVAVDLYAVGVFVHQGHPLMVVLFVGLAGYFAWLLWWEMRGRAML